MNTQTHSNLERTLSALNMAIARGDFDGAVEFLDSYYVGRLAGCAEPQPIGDQRAGRLSRRLREAIRNRDAGMVPPGEIQRVELELIDYQHIPPYRVYIADRGEADTFGNYRAANLFARTQSGANRVPVLIRDNANVAVWAIKLTAQTID
jgi:hypothetical protein